MPDEPDFSQVLNFLFWATNCGWTIGSNIHGAVSSINPETGIAQTSTGEVAVQDLGQVTAAAEASRSNPDPPVVELTTPSGEAWYTQPVNLALIGGGALLLVLAVAKR
jgi:hypothetical protein